MPAFHAIAAMARNRVIGAGNKIPWHLPADFQWFKKSTLGGVLVMGRNTWDSIGRPLPGRETVIVSRSLEAPAGTRVVRDLAELDSLLAHESRPVWICGGAEIYRQLLPRCADLYLSLVDAEPSGDAFFPPFEPLFDDTGIVHEAPGFRVHRYVRKPA